MVHHSKCNAEENFQSNASLICSEMLTDVVVALQVSPEELHSLEGRLSRINQLARFQKAVKAEVPLDFVLGVGGHDLDSVGKELSRVSGFEGSI